MLFPSVTGYRSACLVLLSLLSAGSSVLAETEVRAHFNASAEALYTDNLFHFSDTRLEEFELEKDTNPRFEGLDDTSDIVMRLRARGSLDWKLAARKKFALDLGISSYIHANNSIADYKRVDAAAALDTSKRDRWSLGVRRTIDRFKRNYLATSATDPAVWGRADYDQTDLSLKYRHKFKGKRTVDAVYRHRDRSFTTMFEDRDLTGNYLGAGVEYPLGARWRGRSALEVAAIDSAIGADGLIVVDRSYDQLRVRQIFSAKVARGTHVDIELDYRNRDYKTDVGADDARFDRTDSRLRIEAGLDKKLSKRFTFNTTIGWLDNDQDRIGDILIADETGYTEFELGLGVGYRY